MEIIIGRDNETARLNVAVDNTSHQFGNPNSVPQSVSRQHCKITINEDGTVYLQNLNPDNRTYVNDVAMMRCVLKQDDKVLLGKDRYPLNWKWIEEALPRVADIRPLKAVWENYSNEIRELTLHTQRFQVLRGFLPVFTMSAVLIGYISGGRGWIFYIIYLLVILLTVFFSYKAWKDISNNDLRRDKIRESFERDYCCPECGYFFNNISFHVLSRNYNNCPRCHTPFRK